jgi:hypothetical protein
LDIIKPYRNSVKIQVNFASLLVPNPPVDVLTTHKNLKPGLFGSTDPALDDKFKPKIPAEPTPYTLADLRRHLADETNALKYCIEQAKSAEFNKYPGISWPVKFLRQDNYASFERIHAIPRTTPSLPESADEAQQALKRIADRQTGPADMAKILAMAMAAAQKDRPGTPAPTKTG